VAPVRPLDTDGSDTFAGDFVAYAVLINRISPADPVKYETHLDAPPVLSWFPIKTKLPGPAERPPRPIGCDPHYPLAAEIELTCGPTYQTN
jgi:hypothetical protein